VVVVGLIGAGAYLGWQEFGTFREGLDERFQSLSSQIDQRATRSELDAGIAPLRQATGQSEGRLAALEQQQQGLLASTEKLFELYGRDENGWRLAEVEYLMSVAQHKLILEHDFEGAAKTLNAASSLIAELADPGLLSVRVQINDEIARLKTRKRPDLVGMTLLLSRLSRQILHLKPGYQARAVDSDVKAPVAAVEAPGEPLPLEERVSAFVKSLVTVNRSSRVAEQPPADIIDVTSMLEDNLKLARWSLLDRDAHQFGRLMQDSVDLFKQYYDLENAANADFYGSLSELSKTTIRPDLPDISGSLRLLREIVKKRESLPQGGAGEVINNG
jgi:uroporphyrin-3 C-methyltransferase